MVMNPGVPPRGGSILGALPNLFSGGGGGGLLSALGGLGGGGGSSGVSPLLSMAMNAMASGGASSFGGGKQGNFDINDLLNRLSSVMNNKEASGGYNYASAAKDAADIEIEPIVEDASGDGGFSAAAGAAQEGGGGFSLDDAAALLGLLNGILAKKEAGNPQGGEAAAKQKAAAFSQSAGGGEDAFMRGFQEGFKQGVQGAGFGQAETPQAEAPPVGAAPVFARQAAFDGAESKGCNCRYCRDDGLPSWESVCQMAAGWRRY